jgi:nicotinamide mononucleotide transporter
VLFCTAKLYDFWSGVVQEAMSSPAEAATATTPLPHGRGELHWADVPVMAVVSAFMFLATTLGWWQFSLTEVVGFVTGGICVWLTVREHIANWPIGLVNNLVFFVLFWRGRLFADATLQVFYLALGIYGWWSWRYGGAKRTELIISLATRSECLALFAIIPLATWGLSQFLVAVQGAAPFWDALTTVISLAAQYLMCRKRLEHWLLWMTADVIYVPLYLSRHLTLTALLYFVFLLMCIVGWRQWRLAWCRSRPGATA